MINWQAIIGYLLKHVQESLSNNIPQIENRVNKQQVDQIFLKINFLRSQQCHSDSNIHFLQAN